MLSEVQTTPAEPVRRTRGRPPGPDARVRHAVLVAARDELVEYGYASFRIERVAQRAGVHKTTLYRQWGTRKALAQDAIADWQRARLQATDTGSWAGDLDALCRTLADLYNLPVTRALLRTIVAANAVDPELTDALRDFWRPEAVKVLAPMVKAQERGEMAGAVSPAVLMEMITGPMIQRTILTEAPLDEEFLTTLVAVILAGTAPPGRATTDTRYETGQTDQSPDPALDVS